MKIKRYEVKQRKEKKVITFTCLTYGTGTINSPTSMSPIDLERHKPPGQQRRGPICEFTATCIIKSTNKPREVTSLIWNLLKGKQYLTSHCITRKN